MISTALGVLSLIHQVKDISKLIDIELNFLNTYVNFCVFYGLYFFSLNHLRHIRTQKFRIRFC
jgi:hypothetical protein